MNGREHGLGRLMAKDQNDHKFLMRRMAEEAAKIVCKTWRCYGVLDQGKTNQCVGYSVWNWLASGPIINVPRFAPEWLYRESQKEDEWPGEDYEGTSGRGAFKVLLREGFIGEYRWAFDAATILDHLLAVGPVVVGTNWYKDMDTPDANGVIHIGGNKEGGHEYLLIGGHRDRKFKSIGRKPVVRIVNSWGVGWGQRGRAWMLLEDLERLMHEDGEASIANEVKHALFAFPGGTMFA